MTVDSFLAGALAIGLLGVTALLVATFVLGAS